MAARRIVITGTGLITALGTGTEKTWAGLLTGKSAVGPITKFDASELSARIAGEVHDFTPEAWGMDRRESRRMDLFAQYAVAASEMAMHESGLPIGLDKPNGYEPEKVAVILGSGIGGIGSLEEQHKRALEKGFDRISPFFILQMIINMAPGLVSIRYGAKGPNWSPVSACSTSAHAIGEAVKSIRIGETDAAIAGGAEASITPLSIGGFAVMKALSTLFRRAEPCQPALRQGPGRLRHGRGRRRGGVGGAGARQTPRGQHPLRGGGLWRQLGCLPRDAARAGGEGAARCMRLALKDAGIAPEDIGYINAHGTSTPFNDANETKAIKTVFGAHAKSSW